MESMFTYEMLEEFSTAFSTGEMIYNVLMFGLSIAAYVLQALGLYTIAKRRGISNPWLAWVPVAWVWVLGSISDQFRYVTKAQVKNKRTTLLVLQIAGAVVAAILIVVAVVCTGDFVETAMYATEEEILVEGMSYVLRILGLSLGVGALTLTTAIIRYIALYDLYMSVNPANAVLFLVLGILFSITEPFFIFFNRLRDDGMPPRCDVPQPPVAPVNYSYIPETAVQEPVAEETEESAE